MALWFSIDRRYEPSFHQFHLFFTLIAAMDTFTLRTHVTTMQNSFHLFWTGFLPDIWTNCNVLSRRDACFRACEIQPWCLRWLPRISTFWKCLLSNSALHDALLQERYWRRHAAKNSFFGPFILTIDVMKINFPLNRCSHVSLCVCVDIKQCISARV